MSRFQIDITDDFIKELSELMRITGIKTKRDLVNTAFSLMMWTVKKVKTGKIVASVLENGIIKELVMPIFYEVRKNAV